MCGIAGILSTNQNLGSEAARQRLLAMQSALAHRGPDGHGVYTAPSNRAALCHTRLAIIDLSDAGSQPMQSNDGHLTITFNGEIYNYQELKQKLEAQGEVFRSHSDTEVLLKLYRVHGLEFLNMLRGMFAFVIWDEEEQTAFAARDPLGIKPFYYTTPVGGTIAFASEVRALMKAKLHSEQLSQDGLSSYLRTGTVSEPYSLLQDVCQLPAGHYFTWRHGKLNRQRYSKIEFSSTAMSKPAAIERTRQALEDSVKAHFVSDVPVGIFLSGGIDSTALVALAKKATEKEINTYSIAFESPEWNEGDVAKKVAQHFNTHHTEFLITPDVAKPLFNEFRNVIDQPTIDGFNTFCVSKLAQKSGEKVVLSGVGGDELFAGYQSFTQIPKMMIWGRRLKLLTPLFRFCQATGGRLLSGKSQRILDFLQSSQTVESAHQSLRGIFSNSESRAILHSLNGAENNHTASPYAPIFDEAESGKVLDQISRQELSTYMRNQLLRDSDVMSMACGLELRVPFVDKYLLDEISLIPAELRLQFGKQLLIDAVPELPEFVVERPKQGFRFPFDEWFANEWQDLETQPFEYFSAPAWLMLTPWYRRWALTILNDWLSRYPGQNP